jgi:hypothetical protein
VVKTKKSNPKKMRRLFQGEEGERVDVGEEDVLAGLGKALMRTRQKKALCQMINSNDNLQARMAMRAMHGWL